MTPAQLTDKTDAHGDMGQEKRVWLKFTTVDNNTRDNIVNFRTTRGTLRVVIGGLTGMTLYLDSDYDWSV